MPEPLNMGPLVSLAPKIYDDLVHPSAQRIGDAVGRAIGVALMPAHGALWTAEKALSWVGGAARDKLIERDVSPERIVPPSRSLLGSVVVGVQATGGDETLGDLFANLLASAMNETTAQMAHPAFVEIIRQMSPDEARLLAAFSPQDLRTRTWAIAFRNVGEAGELSNLQGIWELLENPHLIDFYISNLVRLGVLSRKGLSVQAHEWATVDRATHHLIGILAPTSLHNLKAAVRPWMDPPRNEIQSFDVDCIGLTEIGRFFIEACYQPPK